MTSYGRHLYWEFAISLVDRPWVFAISLMSTATQPTQYKLLDFGVYR